MKELTIRKAGLADCERMAGLHMKCIETGFLSSLGTGFLTELYRAAVGSNIATCLVADADGVVIGFIFAVEDTGAFYREFIRNRFLAAGIAILPRLFSIRTLIRVSETLLYPARMPRGAPAAELLSIAVDKARREQGVGRLLFEELSGYFLARGIRRFKTAAGEGAGGAAEFYARMNGFPLLDMEVHKGMKTTLYIWEL